MVKSELILRIADLNPHLRERDVEAVVDAILGRITDALVVGARVELRGLGTFALKSKETRTARNPKTGAAVTVEKKRTLSFRPGKAMKARLIDPEAHRPPAPEHNTQWVSRWLGRGPSVR